MGKLKKIFSKKLPEIIIRKIHFKTTQYLNKIQRKKEEILINKWIEEFKNGHFFVFTIDNGVKINLYKDSILSKLIYDGFEKDEIRFVRKILKKGDVFIDIGANIGLYSLIASKIVGEEGNIISFEPTPETYRRFVENVELNNFANIDARNIGLSDVEGTLDLKQSVNGYDAWNTFAIGDSDKFQNTIPVPVSTLDIQIEELNKSKISLIKIDVEGWEKFVIKGALEILQNYSPVIMIEFTEANTFAAGYLVQELYDLMEELGYKWFRFIDGELFDEKKKLHYPYDNLIAAKNIPFLRERLNMK